MKFDFKKSKRIRSAAVIAWALCVFSGTTTAGSYQSSVTIAGDSFKRLFIQGGFACWQRCATGSGD
ncbi:hypothetical protein V2K55_20875 [Pseudomonas alliivorans]|nr:hypothetical protein [Pseudomonas alliivorans]MEE4779739.1 hypothetical protein [Pseudomonas alliivorans]